MVGKGWMDLSVNLTSTKTIIYRNEFRTRDRSRSEEVSQKEDSVTMR